MHETGYDMQAQARWFEYAFSASTMNVQILFLCRCTDLGTLLSVAFVTFFMVVMGALSEKPGVRAGRALQLITGWIAFVAVWATILVYYGTNIAGAPDYVKGFVTAIIVVEILLEASFGVVHLYFWNVQPDREGQREVAYATLSLVAKVSLALITYFGARSRTFDC
jgi:hypothetical protein